MFIHRRKAVRRPGAALLRGGLAAVVMLVAAAGASWAGLPLAGEAPGGLAGVAPVGYNFPIRLGTGQDVVGGSPGIAFDGANFLVPWFQGADIYALRVNVAGTVLDTQPISISVGLNAEAAAPSVVFDGTNFIVIWAAQRASANELFGARVTPGGAVLDPGGLQLTTGANPLIRRPGVAFGADSLLVAWRTNGNNIRATRVTTSAVNLDAPDGFPIVTDGSSYYPAAAFDGTNFLVVWHDSRAGGTTGLDIYGARVEPDGDVLDPGGFLIADDPQNQEHATVGFDGVNYLVAWYDWRPNDHQLYGSAYGARVSPSGVVLDDPAFLIADRARGQVPVRVDCAGLNCLVAWGMPFEPGDGYNYRLTDIYARRVVSGTVLDAQAIPAATAYGHQFGPVVGYGAGHYLVAWSESTGRDWSGSIYAQLLQEQPAWAGHARAALANSQPAPTGEAGWTLEAAPVNEYLNSGVAFSAADSYAFGDYQAVHYTGTTWMSEVIFMPYEKTFAAWASAPDNIFVAGWCGAVNIFDGGGWEDEGCQWIPPAGLGFATGLWGTGLDPEAVWASTTGGHILKRGPANNNYQWIPFAAGVPYDLNDLWGAAPDDLYAVGERGAIIHFNGSDWTPLPNLPTGQTLNAIWGSGPDDLFAAGDWGTILHYDGQAWVTQASGAEQHLFDLWGSSGSNVYAVGLGGTILHYDGTHWTPEASGTSQDLLAVWGVSDPLAGQIVVWAAGAGSTILKKSTTLERAYLPTISRP